MGLDYRFFQRFALQRLQSDIMRVQRTPFETRIHPEVVALPTCRFAFVTNESTSTPPHDGAIIPVILAHAPGEAPKVRVRGSIFSKLGGMVHRKTTPAVKIHINGKYVGGTFAGSSTEFTTGLISESALQECRCVVVSRAAWVQKVWDKAWGVVSAELELPIPWPSKWAHIEPHQFIEHYEGPLSDQPLKAASGRDMRLIAIMLLQNFWDHHPDFTLENRSDDLKALSLAANSYDRRSFSKDAALAGGVLKGFEMPIQFFHDPKWKDNIPY